MAVVSSWASMPSCQREPERCREQAGPAACWGADCWGNGESGGSGGDGGENRHDSERGMGQGRQVAQEGFRGKRPQPDRPSGRLMG